MTTQVHSQSLTLLMIRKNSLISYKVNRVPGGDNVKFEFRKCSKIS